MKKVYLGLGSNLGDRHQFLSEAVRQLGRRCGDVVSVSPVYESEPVGFASDELFLNMVVAIETGLTASDLLAVILDIEKVLGRERKENEYTSRTIDIDLLLYGDDILNENRLVVPHPRMTERRFVLLPLSDIAPLLVHPLLGTDIKSLLERCPDKTLIRPADIQISPLSAKL
ncbi:MAG: 2-amino-4-hydroxy-6-hydroxymethyldihydropteridine diphosphokinase [Bacteroidales bacterium]